MARSSRRAVRPCPFSPRDSTTASRWSQHSARMRRRAAPVSECIRAYQTPRGPAAFRRANHLRRFHASTHILGFLEQPYSVEQLTAAVDETIRANGFDECYIRPLIYLADGGWNLTLDSGKPHVGIAVWQQSVYL